jgi:hypothetical protein
LSNVAKKRKMPSGTKLEVLDYAAGGGYPYFKTILGVMVTFALIVSLAVLQLLGTLELLVILIVAMTITVVYGLSPALTSHQLGATALVLRHGWYFKARLPLSNIKEVGETEEGVPGHGVSFLLGGRKLYVTNSRVGLVNIALHERQRIRGTFGKNITEVVLNVDEPDRFIKDVMKRAGLKGATEDGPEKCPKCGRPMVDDVEDPSKATGPDRPEVHMVDCIFLVHNDGRLIQSYKSGRIATKETFSVTGMFTVVQDFVTDALKRTEGSLKTLEHGDLRILIERGASVYLAVIFEGAEPKELRREMRRVLKEIDSGYGDILDEDWDGEITDLKGLKKILAQILWL